MNTIFLLRQARKERGYSQVQLSTYSGVSLPTIQNIEANKGNPSLEVLEKLAYALGLSIRLEPEHSDWNLLVVCGLPLLATAPVLERPTPELLVRQILLAATELSHRTPADSRNAEAFFALLWAIKSSFPLFFERNLSRSPLIQRLFPKPSARLIRLRRIAIENLSRYL